MHAFRCYIFAARIACDSGPTCLYYCMLTVTNGSQMSQVSVAHPHYQYAILPGAEYIQVYCASSPLVLAITSVVTVLKILSAVGFGRFHEKRSADLDSVSVLDEGIINFCVHWPLSVSRWYRHNVIIGHVRQQCRGNNYLGRSFERPRYISASWPRQDAIAPFNMALFDLHLDHSTTTSSLRWHQALSAVSSLMHAMQRI